MKTFEKSKILMTFALATFISPTAIAQSQFGMSGNDGFMGQSGASGRDGRPLVITTNGTGGNYDISGQDGYPGRNGQSGSAATGCFQGQPDNDLRGADGGDGGMGGSGGNGGNGGMVTAYYSDISALSSIYIRGTPGRAGNGAWGGRGGNGCRCMRFSWEGGLGDSHRTYHCYDGRDGRDGMNGNTGRDGSYGSVTLIGQTTPVGPEQPSFQIDMAHMLDNHFILSKNHWENRRGARQLFSPGSDIADTYRLFTGRTEIDYDFQWLASRPISDFTDWQMTLQLDGDEANLYLPQGLWVDSEKIRNGNRRTFIFHAAVSTGELGNIQFDSFSGSESTHVIAVKDNAGVSDVLTNTVHLQYFAASNGSYQLRYDADVPAAAITSRAGGFDIAMGALGIDSRYLALGTQAYAGLTVKRALGTNSASYTLGSYYTIRFMPHRGDLVQARVDSDLFTGTQVIGHVSRGDRFRVVDIQGDWISLQREDGTAVRGWITVSNLEAAQ